jgi:DNA adenine methylase
MFRTNKDGHFNIPYGGASYNSRDLGTKIERMLTRGHDLFVRAEIVTADFRDAWEVAGIGPDDLVFCDPPYDSSFSTYDEATFGRSEHRALADLVTVTDSQALVVVGRTSFTDALWEEAAKAHPNLRRFLYPVRYTYSVKGRNEQAVEHLVITTFDPLAIPTSFQSLQ